MQGSICCWKASVLYSTDCCKSFSEFYIKCLISVENGETEMSPEESWEHKEEISEAELGGCSMGDGRAAEESAQEMMEEEEEIPKPKSVVAPPGAPKKEHVNVVFIGHVGKLPSWL